MKVQRSTRKLVLGLLSAACLFQLLLWAPGVEAQDLRAQSADLTPLFRQLNSDLKDLRVTKAVIDDKTLSWQKKRGTLLGQLKEAKAKGDAEALDRINLEIAEGFAGYLVALNGIIDTGIGRLRGISTTYAEIARQDVFNPEARALKAERMERVRSITENAIQWFGSDEEARKYLGDAVELIRAWRIGSGDEMNGTQLERVGESIVSRLQLWIAWREKVVAMRGATKLQLMAWAIRLASAELDELQGVSIDGDEWALDLNNPLAMAASGGVPSSSQTKSRDELEKEIESLRKKEGGR